MSHPALDAAPSERAHRLLTALHHVCSHDLSNQAIALESLLHLFVLDEREQLSPQGQEYLERLQSVSRKISSMAQFLRDLVRLQRHEITVSEIQLEPFVTELKGEVQRHLPDHTFTWQIRFQAPAVTADRRLLLQGVGALVRATADTLSETALLVSLTSEPLAGSVRLHVAVAPQAKVASLRVSPTTTVERRLEFSLAQELLDLTDIVCRQEATGGTAAFALTIPQRSSHG